MSWLWKTVVIFLLILILAGAVVLIANPQKTTPIDISARTTRYGRIGVYGAVNLPGIYSYEGNIRIADAVEMAGGFTDAADEMHANLAKWVEDGETIIIPTAGPNEPTLTVLAPENEKIDLNHANKAELMKLPGIGEKRANDILALRAEKGEFTSVDELLEISGISEKLLDSIYDRLIITEL